MNFARIKKLPFNGSFFFCLKLMQDEHQLASWCNLTATVSDRLCIFV